MCNTLLDVLHASGAKAEDVIARLRIPRKAKGCTVISSEYLLSRPFAVANLYNRLNNISNVVSIICYTRDKAEFSLSAFRNFFRHTPTILRYLKSSRHLKGDSVYRIKPETAFLFTEACNNFRFLSAGIPRHMLWNEALMTIRSACGISRDQTQQITEVRIPNGFKDFDIVTDFLRRTNLHRKSSRFATVECIHSNKGPDPRLVNSLLHYQLTGQISHKARLPDNLVSLDSLQAITICEKAVRTEKAVIDFFRIAAEQSDGQDGSATARLQRAISFNIKRIAASMAIESSATSDVYKGYYLPLEAIRDLIIRA